MTLQLYVLRRLTLSFGLSLGGILFLVLPSIAVQAVHKLGGVGMSAVIGYLPLVLVELAPYLLPMAFLLGVVSTFGQLAANEEWTAIRMAGVHPLSILFPCFLLALALVVATDWLMSSVAPDMKYRKRDYVREVREEGLRTLGGGRTEIDLGDFYLNFEGKDPNDPSRLREVILSLPVEGGEDRVLVADSVRVTFESDFMLLEFENVEGLTEDVEFRLESPRHRMPLAAIESYEPPDRRNAKYRTSAELKAQIELGELDDFTLALYQYAIHARHALALTYVLFLLLGAPTGLSLKSGTHLGAMSGAIGYGFAYYLLSLRLGRELSDANAVPAIVAAWSTDVLFGLVGLVLFVRTVRR